MSEIKKVTYESAYVFTREGSSKDISSITSEEVSEEAESEEVVEEVAESEDNADEESVNEE